MVTTPTITAMILYIAPEVRTSNVFAILDISNEDIQEDLLAYTTLEKQKNLDTYNTLHVSGHLVDLVQGSSYMHAETVGTNMEHNSTVQEPLEPSEEPGDPDDGATTLESEVDEVESFTNDPLTDKTSKPKRRRGRPKKGRKN